jgi:hypothetical protein
VSHFDDDEDVMADEQMSGRSTPGDEPLAAVLGRLRAMAEEPAPPPSPALAAVLRDGLPAVLQDPPPATAGSRSRVLRGLRWAAGLGVAGKILLGAGVAAAAVAGTATLPVVPDAVQAPVRTALTDLGRLIPGVTGDAVPVPATTTPPSGDDDAVPAVGRVPATSGDGSADRRTGEDAGGTGQQETEPSTGVPAAGTVGRDRAHGSGSSSAVEGGDRQGQPIGDPGGDHASDHASPPARATQPPADPSRAGTSGELSSGASDRTGGESSQPTPSPEPSRSSQSSRGDPSHD